MPTILNPRRRSVTRHALIALLIAWGAALAIYGVRFWKEIPVLSAKDFSLPQTILITDRDGREIIRFHEGRDVVEIGKDDMPESLRQAFVAIEDRRFWDRQCIDVRALTRAAY